MSRNAVSEITEGAHLQAFCLRTAGLVSGWLHYRGMERFAWALGRLFSAENSAIMELPSGGRLRVYLRDGYWARLFIPGFRYEPEVQFVLIRALAQPDVFFLDCGANIGYWSAVASNSLPGRGRVVAIEPSPPNFDQLRENAELNGNRFDCVLAALWSRDNEKLVIVSHDKRHAGSSVVERRDKAGQPGYRKDTVPSVTLDTLCERYIQDAGAKVIIKLDVEGAEIPALDGARKLLASRRPLIVYEDHGHDPACRVSEYFLDRLGYYVYYCNGKRSVARMNSLLAVRGVKKLASTGYNFIACAPDSIFLKMLDELCH